MPGDSFFISDLHKFSRRSDSDRHDRTIFEAAARAKTFVLGGDIFDFRWSTLPSVNATVEAAIEWLDRLVDHNADCDFHFVLGNHDSNLQFVERLSQLADEKQNLSSHHHYVRLGQSLFLHGDVADRRAMTSQGLVRHRTRYHEEEQLPEYRHKIYDVVVRLGLHRLATALVYRPRRVAKRIVGYLDDIGHGPDSGLRNVYFGHTHAPLADYEYRGLRFHNGGAPIKGLKFRIVETVL